MMSDSSISSLSSTISFHSIRSPDISASSISQDNTDDPLSSSFELELYPPNASLDSSDSNLDHLTDIIVEEMAIATSCIYEISLELSMDLPRVETFNRPDMLRASIFTVTGDIVFRFKFWEPLGPLIAYQLGRAVNPTNSMWMALDKDRLTFTSKVKVLGHCFELDEVFENPVFVHEDLEFHDSICNSPATLNYKANVFISPAISGAERIYSYHGFNTGLDCYYCKKQHLEDIKKAHKCRQLKCYNHHLAWATVYNVLEDYRININKQNQFMKDYGFGF